MQQWYKCPQCGKDVLYITNPCPHCKLRLDWRQQPPIPYIPTPVEVLQPQVVHPPIYQQPVEIPQQPAYHQQIYQPPVEAPQQIAYQPNVESLKQTHAVLVRGLILSGLAVVVFALFLNILHFEFLSSELWWIFFWSFGLVTFIAVFGRLGSGTHSPMINRLGIAAQYIIVILSFILFWWQGGVAMIVAWLLWLMFLTPPVSFLIHRSVGVNPDKKAIYSLAQIARGEVLRQKLPQRIAIIWGHLSDIAAATMIKLFVHNDNPRLDWGLNKYRDRLNSHTMVTIYYWMLANELVVFRTYGIEGYSIDDDSVELFKVANKFIENLAAEINVERPLPLPESWNTYNTSQSTNDLYKGIMDILRIPDNPHKRIIRTHFFEVQMKEAYIEGIRPLILKDFEELNTGNK